MTHIESRVSPAALKQRAQVASGQLPSRYAEAWDRAFLDMIEPRLIPGCTVIDVGGGARPTIDAAGRPLDCRYIGLDISRSELERAEPGDYNEICAADICAGVPELAGVADLVISWQVLEHVASMTRALSGIRDMLKPGGRLVALFSGAYAPYALVVRVIPHRPRTILMDRLLGMPPEEKFPTKYDACTPRRIAPMLEADWSSYTIVPRYRAASYFDFSPRLQRQYVKYENFIELREVKSLATHFLLTAEK